MVGKLVLFVLSGIAGAAAAAGILFFISYAVCWLLAEALGDKSYMFYMWFSIPLGGAAVLVGFAGGVLICGWFLARRKPAYGANNQSSPRDGGPDEGAEKGGISQ